MITYDLIGSDVYTKRVLYKPKTCFIMTQMEKPLPTVVTSIRKTLRKCLTTKSMKDIDAGSDITGKDFLDKIWDMILSVPIGVAIISEDMPLKTISNIYFELGLMQAIGKETVIIKTSKAQVPSDFIRTEYIEYTQRNLNKKIDNFLSKLSQQAEHYAIMAGELELNPLLATDYLKRAYLITANPEYKSKMIEILVNCSSLDKQCQTVISDVLKV